MIVEFVFSWSDIVSNDDGMIEVLEFEMSDYCSPLEYINELGESFLSHWFEGVISVNGFLTEC